MDNRIEKGIKTAGIILGSTGAAAAVSYLTTRFLMKMAMDREMPKAAQNAGNLIAGRKADDEFIQVLKRTSQKLAETPNEEIEISAYDGVRLVGHYIPCEEPKRIIIAMHGWRSSWHSDFGMVSDAWKEHNCSVLYVEQRGQNNSGGEFMGFGLTERYDCVSWINWVIDHLGSELPIYLAGVSMGATTVMLAAGLGLPAEVHGIMADCGFTSPDAIWKHIAMDNLHMVYGIKGMIADDLYQKKTKETTDQYSTEEALSHSDIPILFVHGSDDHFVPVTMTYDNYKACASPKHLLIVPGADHGMSYFVDKLAYERTVLDFWNKYDHYERPSKKHEI